MPSSGSPYLAGTKPNRGLSKGKGTDQKNKGSQSSINSSSAETTPRTSRGKGKTELVACLPPNIIHRPHSCDGIPLHNTIYETTSEGQGQLVRLNERLAAFLNQQRSGSSVEIREFRSLLDSVTIDADRVRETFEKQISSLQMKIEQLHREHAEIYSKYQSCKIEKRETELRWKKGKDNYEKVEAELEIMRRRLLEVEQLKLKLEAQIAALESDIGHNGGDVTSRYEELIKKYESVERNYYEEKKRVERLEEDLRIQTDKYKKSKVEWEKRIQIFQETIVRLEKRVETSTSSVDFTAILEQLREQCASEMHHHHHVTEEALQESLQKLQVQMKESRSLIESLQTENASYKKNLMEYKSKAAEYETKVKHMEEHMSSQSIEMTKERESFSAKMMELEERSMEFYRQYLEKTRECTEAREAQFALKTEIQGYKAILDAEERRSQGTYNSWGSGGQVSKGTNQCVECAAPNGQMKY